MADLFPMDLALLNYLIEHGGSVPYAGIPSKIFKGEIPDGAMNLVDLGVVKHIGNDVVITDLGRCSLTSTVREGGS